MNTQTIPDFGEETLPGVFFPLPEERKGDVLDKAYDLFERSGKVPPMRQVDKIISSSRKLPDGRWAEDRGNGIIVIRGGRAA